MLRSALDWLVQKVRTSMFLTHKLPTSFERNVLGWRFGPATRQG